MSSARVSPGSCWITAFTVKGNETSAATAHCRKWKNIPQIITAAGIQKRNYSAEKCRKFPRRRNQMGKPSTPGAAAANRHLLNTARKW